LGDSGRGRSLGDDVDAAAFFFEFDVPINQSEQGPVAARANVLAGMHLGAALADDDAAGGDEFAAKRFDSEALAVAVAPVFAAALTFLVSHKIS
jgi:hypothetical protein